MISYADICALAAVAIGVGALFTIPVHGALAAFSPLRWFGLGFFLFNVAAPVHMMLTEDPVSSEPAFTSLLLMSAAGAGAYRMGWQEGGRSGRTGVANPPTFTPRVLARIAVIAATLGITGTVLIIMRSGGVTPFLMGTEARLELIGMSLYNIVCLLTAQYVAAIGIVSHRIMHTRRKWGLGILLCLLLAAFLLTSLKLGSRTRILFGVVCVVFFLGLASTKRRALLCLVIAICCLPLAVQYGQIRSSHLSLRDQVGALFSVDRTDPSAGRTASILGSAEFDAFLNGVYLIEVVRERGEYLYGASFVAALINPIPRQLWPNKPVVDIVEPMRRLAVGKGAVDNANIAVSFIAECYVNFGWCGVIGGPFLLAYVMSRFQRLVCSGCVDPIVGILHVGLAVFSFMVCRGSFTIIFTMACMVIVMPVAMLSLRYCGIHLFVRHRRRIYDRECRLLSPSDGRTWQMAEPPGRAKGRGQ